MKPSNSKTPVPPEVYSRDYFLHARQGSDEFVRSGGAELSSIHTKLLGLARPGPGRKILDVGCGCGELVIHAALRGAEATGLDYAEAAIELAREAAVRQGVAPRFVLGDVADLPDERFDAILMADVVEHLTPEQLSRLYRDLGERLAPGGEIIIHTWPNRWHTEYAYPVARVVLLLAGIRKPKSPRKPHDEIMHVNEQSLFSLKDDLRRAGFEVRAWLEHECPPGSGFIYRFTHTVPLFRLFFADHIFAVARTGPNHPGESADEKPSR